jgi:DNA-binding PadR family transcriptional regulator
VTTTTVPAADRAGAATWATTPQDAGPEPTGAATAAARGTVDRGGARAGAGARAAGHGGAVRGLVLSVLAEGPAHGYDVMQRLETRSGGMWRPSPGSVYPLLQMLEDEGLVSSDERDGRRTYQLTEAGRAEADAQKASGSAPWEEGAGEEARALREAVGEVVQAARQVARHGRPEQISRSMEAVRGARKAIYEILAED